MTSTTRSRATAGITLLLATSLALTACGTDGTDTTDEPAAEENRTSPALRRSQAPRRSPALRRSRSPTRSSSPTRAVSTSWPAGP
ncbi:hypothetical protein [Streptomyces bikiniensis]|uniref:hypothetical protein n=1 Tax=Streptomyces bikiniensis TaxID=1896 RepID=UPI00131A498F